VSVLGKFTYSFFLACLVLCSSCGPAKDGAIAKIHQSWDARFSYDYEKRRLVSVNKKRMRGRTWGRDEFGRADYDRYWTGRPILSQDLLESYKVRMDSILEERWYVAENERLTRVAEEMEHEVKRGEKPDEKEKGEGTSKENPDDIAPIPFLPQGIELENPLPDDKGGEPFLPLPEVPALPEPDPNAPPEVAPEPVPSPFAPLPPL
jgi:hypothetical protein